MGSARVQDALIELISRCADEANLRYSGSCANEQIEIDSIGALETALSLFTYKSQNRTDKSRKS